MSTIELPLTRRMHRYAHLLLLTAAGMVLACPIAWVWRFGCAACVAVSWLVLWRRFRRQRPVSLQIHRNGGLSCRLASAQTWTVTGIRPGVIRPWLVSARLLGGPGQRCELFVLGTCVSDAQHRELRRALIGFRPVTDPTQP